MTKSALVLTRWRRSLPVFAAILMVAACRDQLTNPPQADTTAPVITFGELANRLLADPLLRRIAERVNRPDVAAHVDAVLAGIRDRTAVSTDAGALAFAGFALASSVGDSAAVSDSTTVPTEDDILQGVLNLALETVSLMANASQAPVQTTFYRVR
jgi:hypothetical protein